MQVIPSIDIAEGRSRLVFWPGASTGTGTPTDRPERIARQFVELGAPGVHVVDMDGARRGQPVALEAVSRIASAVAVPLQVAGGADGPDQIQLLFAAGATRVVMPLLAVAEDAARLRACVDVAGSWLAVGLDPRPDRMREHGWQGGAVPTLTQLVERLADAGVQRFVLSHGGEEPDPALLASLLAAADAEFSVAGGITSVEGIRRVAGTGVSAVILGEALLSGRIDYREAMEAAKDAT